MLKRSQVKATCPVSLLEMLLLTHILHGDRKAQKPPFAVNDLDLSADHVLGRNPAGTIFQMGSILGGQDKGDYF